MKPIFAASLVLYASLSAHASLPYCRPVLPFSKAHAILLPAIPEKKHAALRLYPNPSSNGRVQVVSNTAGALSFYIFGLDGTLLHQAVLQENEKHTVTGLKKGTYTYDAFYNDEGVDHGQLIVK